MKSSKAQYKYSIRRLKKSIETTQNNEFLNRLINQGSGNIYQEIKKFRGKRKVVSSRIDQTVGNKQIADHFANKYQDLYSKCELGSTFEELHDTIDGNISDDDVNEILMINEDLIEEALDRMKAGKSDVNFSFSSDCLSNRPKCFY